jgi:transcriptional regulator with XRE-family HTH domain
MRGMVNSYLPGVNTHLPEAAYVHCIVPGIKGKKRGPKKGQTKPLPRPLDHEFPDRLRKAMGRISLVGPGGKTLNSELASKCGCTRQAIGQYFKPDRERRTIDAILLLRLCDALSVTPYWLALNQGTIDDVPLYSIPMSDVRKRVQGKS